MKRIYFSLFIVTVIATGIACSFKNRQQKLIASLKEEEYYKSYLQSINSATALERKINKEKSEEFVVPLKKPTRAEQKVTDSIRKIQEKLERKTIANEKGETRQSLLAMQGVYYSLLFHEYVVEKKMDTAVFNEIMGENWTNQFFDRNNFR